jgi:tRNA(His) 5'-end guanylyltransferase
VAFNATSHAEGVRTSALFDCRAFVVPYAEVVDYFAWRQADAFKNCISTYAYWELRKESDAATAHRRLHGLSTNQRQELIFEEFGVNPNDLQTRWKRGVCLRRVERELPLRDVLEPEKLTELLEAGHVEDPDETVTRRPWELDEEIPRFEKDPGYIEAFLP